MRERKKDREKEKDRERERNQIKLKTVKTNHPLTLALRVVVGSVWIKKELFRDLVVLRGGVGKGSRVDRVQGEGGEGGDQLPGGWGGL